MTSSTETKTSWLKRNKLMVWTKGFYHWTMGWAEHPMGTWALVFFTTIEAIFFPLPVDPLLIAMGAAKPKRALFFAGLASFFSVVGGFGGYFLGVYFWEHTQGFFYQYLFSPEKFDFVIQKFQENAFITIFLAGFTPIPFKVFTIAAGVAKLNLGVFFIGAALSRSLRYFIIGTLLYFFGPQIRKKLETDFEKITIWIGIILVLGVVIYKLLP